MKATKEKLETLKTAAQQAEEALKEGTITQEQYRRSGVDLCEWTERQNMMSRIALIS